MNFKNKNNKHVKLSNIGATCTIYQGLFIRLDLIFMLVILKSYFGETLYCDDLNSSLNTTPELRGEDNSQLDSRLNVDKLHVLHS